jgi:hypothetical protein
VLVGEQHDPRVFGSEADLVLGEDHPGRHLAAHLALLQLRPVRQHRSRQCDGDRRAGAEVPRAADDRARLALPHVDAAQLQPVGVGVFLRREDAPDAEQLEVAVRVGDADALDPVDLGGRHRQPVRKLGERHVDRDVVAEP